MKTASAQLLEVIVTHFPFSVFLFFFLGFRTTCKISVGANLPGNSPLTADPCCPVYKMMVFIVSSQSLHLFQRQKAELWLFLENSSLKSQMPGLFLPQKKYVQIEITYII